MIPSHAEEGITLGSVDATSKDTEDIFYRAHRSIEMEERDPGIPSKQRGAKKNYTPR